MSKVLPQAIQDRQELNLRQGIKSSLNHWKRFLASIYLYFLYLCEGGEDTYCKERQVDGRTILEVSESFAAWLNECWNKVPSVVLRLAKSSLYSAQIEHLQVGLGLFLKLAKVKFVDTNRGESSERTGGCRYRKRLFFSTNMKMVADVISKYSIEEKVAFLDDWLSDNDNELIGNRLKYILTSFTEECQYKIRTTSGELSFQQDGIYERLRNPLDTVESTDTHEPVGPFRIL